LSFFRKDEDYVKAKKLLEKIEQSDDVVFYSSLVLLEIIDVIRRKYPQKFVYKGRDPTIQAEIECKIEDKIKIILDIFSRWESSEMAKFVNPTISVVDYHQKTFSNLRSCYGDVRCDNKNNEYYYYGPGNDDVQHALIAKECHANELISFDEGFEKFKTMKDFENLKITVQ
jgi:predicted nucleic acid-binding protein